MAYINRGIQFFNKYLTSASGVSKLLFVLLTKDLLIEEKIIDHLSLRKIAETMKLGFESIRRGLHILELYDLIKVNKAGKIIDYSLNYDVFISYLHEWFIKEIQEPSKWSFTSTELKLFEYLIKSKTFQKSLLVYYNAWKTESSLIFIWYFPFALFLISDIVHSIYIPFRTFLFQIHSKEELLNILYQSVPDLNGKFGKIIQIDNVIYNYLLTNVRLQKMLLEVFKSIKDELQDAWEVYVKDKLKSDIEEKFQLIINELDKYYEEVLKFSKEDLNFRAFMIFLTMGEVVFHEKTSFSKKFINKIRKLASEINWIQGFGKFSMLLHSHITIKLEKEIIPKIKEIIQLEKLGTYIEKRIEETVKIDIPENEIQEILSTFFKDSQKFEQKKK